MRLTGEKEFVIVSSLTVSPILSAANTYRDPFEIASLEEEIRSAGHVINPFLCWKFNGESLIVDGKNRYDIVSRLHKIENFSPLVEVEWCEFASIEEAVYWIGIHQFNHRKPTIEEEAYYNGRLYEDFRDRDKLNAFMLAKGRGIVVDPNVAELLGEIQNKNKRYLLRSHKFFLGIEKIKSTNPELAQAILKRQSAQEEDEEIKSLTMEMVMKFHEINSNKSIKSIGDIMVALKKKAERDKNEKVRIEKPVTTPSHSVESSLNGNGAEVVPQLEYVNDAIHKEEEHEEEEKEESKPVATKVTATIQPVVEVAKEKKEVTPKKEISSSSANNIQANLKTKFESYLNNPTRETLDVLIKDMESFLEVKNRKRMIAA